MEMEGISAPEIEAYFATEPDSGGGTNAPATVPSTHSAVKPPKTAPLPPPTGESFVLSIFSYFILNNPTIEKRNVAFHGTSGASEWTEKYSDKHQRKYWRHNTTGERTWKDPTKPNTPHSLPKTPRAAPKAEVGDVFATGSSPASSAAGAVPAALKGDPRLKTYDMMRKMLPEGAVRQKMEVDGISQADIDAYFGGGAGGSEERTNSSSSSSSGTAPASTGGGANIDPRYEKFVKMMKMLPEGAVRQKMSIEGFSDSEIDSFVENGAPAAGNSPLPAESSALAPPASTTGSGPIDPRYEKFVKMQKILPEGPVRQKMSIEGFSDQEIDNFIANGPPSAGTGAASSAMASSPAPGRGGLMAQIQGQVVLKKTGGPDASKPRPVPGGGSGGGLTLLDQLKGGVNLKKVRNENYVPKNDLLVSK